VLETGEIKPVGGVTTRHVDIRLIAATNRDLAELVKERAFREDLYYRLNVVPLRLPPLRERPSDIPQLLHHFLTSRREHGDRGPRRFAPEAIERLVSILARQRASSEHGRAPGGDAEGVGSPRRICWTVAQGACSVNTCTPRTNGNSRRSSGGCTSRPAATSSVPSCSTPCGATAGTSAARQGTRAF
jgi:hypothetical protein